jgi:tetratricopeptide (TPR) repeat protein
MFKHVFSTMNEVLDQILKEYPQSVGEEKESLEEQLQVLKAMSDEFIESWLLFEEKLGTLYGTLSINTQNLYKELLDLDVPGKQTVEFLKGQGYYKLFMYDQAVTEFEKLVRLHPDFLLARIYLAMCYLRTDDMHEAYRHFQFLLPLTDNTKMKAISYNAMGCIQVQNKNLEKAYEYFKKAYHHDPYTVDTFLNLDE